MKTACVLLLSVILLFQAYCSADTFTHNTDNITYHGYATGDLKEGKNVVITQEKGELGLNLADYEIEYNKVGRNNFISLLHVVGAIESEIVTEAFVTALKEEADKGPLLILIEIDSPGGRVDLCKKMCAGISDIRYCTVVAYIKGGENGGAYSAAAAVSLACDDIYMVPEVSIGAATIIAGNRGMVEIYGETVGEKFDSAWRNYLATLAEQNGRSGAIAKAMATKEVEVIEVNRNGNALFIEPKDKLPGDVQVRTLCEKGEILTLTAKKALECNIADAIYDSRQAIMAGLDLGIAPVTANPSLDAAQEEYDKVLKRFKKIVAKIEELYMTIDYQMQVQPLATKRTYPQLIKSLEYLLRMKEQGQDIPISEESVHSFLSEMKAQYKTLNNIR